jgi:hypothetical protein
LGDREKGLDELVATVLAPDEREDRGSGVAQWDRDNTRQSFLMISA